jgi:hypothetical protein
LRICDVGTEFCQCKPRTDIVKRVVDQEFVDRFPHVATTKQGLYDCGIRLLSADAHAHAIAECKH